MNFEAMKERRVETIENDGQVVFVPKCASCVFDAKTNCPAQLEHKVLEHELKNGDPLSYKIVWCHRYEKRK